jgi:GT2 family glycosyltransferase
MYTEEVDYCYRIKKGGWKVVYNPKWSIVHFGGSSSTKEFSIINEIKGVKRFYKKYYPAWQYPALRVLLKMGMLGRMMIFGLLEGKRVGKNIWKSF